MNTLFDAEALLPVLRASYVLAEPLGCEIIRRGFNDNYLVTSGGSRYVLRVYFNGKYYISSPDDFRFELDLVAHLAAAGIPVAEPVTTKDGQWLGTLRVSAETRCFALFHYAEGEPPPRDIPPARAHELGTLVGRLHRAADAFESPYRRYHLDLRYVLDEPLRLLEEQLVEHNLGTLEFLRTGAAAWRRQVERLPRENGAYGIIHADLHRSNMHYDRGRGFTFFDFDHCAYGWRAYDLCTLWMTLEDRVRPALLDGYASVRPLQEAEREVLPLFVALRRLWDTGDVLAMMPVWGKVPERAYIERVLEQARRLAASTVELPS